MTFMDRTIVTEAAPFTAPMVDPGRAEAATATELAPLLSVLLMMIDQTRSLVVNVASAQPGAGTSTVARRLATVAASTGWCRVALLDARPAASEAGRGLLDAIERGDSPALVQASFDHVTVDTGRLSTGGRALSRIDSVRKLYGLLRDQYTLIIVDCPAILSGPQTLSMAAAADETVLVVEAERTALDDVARAREALERRGADVLGLVMNKSRRRVPSLFGRRS